MENSEYIMTIIVPVYNEIENLDRVVDTFKNLFEVALFKCKVLFVDDGSTDGSYEKIVTICRNNSNFEYIKFKENCGLSCAIKAGIDNIDTELIGYIDADLQTTPFDFNKLLKYISDYDSVIGFRKKRQDTFSKKIQSKIANYIRRKLIDDGIKDTGCPLKVIKTSVAKKIPFFKGMHRFLPALIQLQGGMVKQVEVQHFQRVAGVSKFNMFNRAFKSLVDAFAFRWMRNRYIKYKIVDTNIKK
ncbi:MAG: glycosyltransferase [Candidatus Marinimicrobia bacterium]|nr:glycosyltransferase [Candidatus Neomarinimicrobiota bacterium]